MRELKNPPLVKMILRMAQRRPSNEALARETPTRYNRIENAALCYGILQLVMVQTGFSSPLYSERIPLIGAGRTHPLLLVQPDDSSLDGNVNLEQKKNTQKRALSRSSSQNKIFPLQNSSSHLGFITLGKTLRIQFPGKTGRTEDVFR